MGNVGLALNSRAILVKHKDDSIRMNSRSGAFFVALSDWVLDNDGTVYGAILEKNNTVIHSRAESKIERDQICKSKYVQSRIGHIFCDVEEDLNSGKYVLFTGTGCQVQGLINYLTIKHINRKKLITVDIVCHGVPSPKLFSEFIEYLESKYSGKVTKFEFRDKTVHGWDDYIETFVVNGKKYKSVQWRGIFNSDLALRPSCYDCKFSSVDRKSDFTIADAWGIKTADPDFNDNRGVSLVIIHSDSVVSVLSQVLSSCDWREIPLENYMQKNLIAPTSCNELDRKNFWNLYYKNGITEIVKRFGHISMLSKIKSCIKYFLKKILKGRNHYLP